MKDVVEIYTKVVLAVYGFVAPSFTLLMSLVLEGIDKRKKRSTEESHRTAKLIADLQKEAYQNPNIDLSAELAKETNNHNKKQKTHNSELQLLNPKRQIIRVFLPLTLSLFFVSLYHLARTDYSHAFMQSWTALSWLKSVVLVASGASFCYALFVLKQIFCIIIDTKRMLIEDQKAEVVQAATSTQRPEPQGAFIVEVPVLPSDLTPHPSTESHVEKASKPRPNSPKVPSKASNRKKKPLNLN